MSPVYQPPPEGWFDFGHHAEGPVPPLEFSWDRLGEDLMPLWERHADESIHCHPCARNSP